MKHLAILSRGVGVAALIALSSTMAVAGPGKADRARAAIAEAHGKIDAAMKIGAVGDAPIMTTRAQTSLKIAEEDLASGHKDDAIAAATHASELADMALVHAHNTQVGQAQAGEANAQASAQAAQQAAADANARADSAQQAANQSAAEADALRNAPPPAPVVVPVAVPAPPPAPTTTTVATTERTVVHHATRKPVVRKVVYKKRAPGHATVAEKTTTTTVTTQ